MFEEMASAIIEGMDQYGAKTDVFRHQRAAPERLLQQSRAQFLPLSRGVDGQARQNHCQDRVWHVLPDRTCRILVSYSPGCQA